MFERFHTHLDFDSFREKKLKSSSRRNELITLTFRRRDALRSNESLYDLFLRSYINLYYRQFFIVVGYAPHYIFIRQNCQCLILFLTRRIINFSLITHITQMVNLVTEFNYNFAFYWKWNKNRWLYGTLLFLFQYSYGA